VQGNVSGVQAMPLNQSSYQHVPNPPYSLVQFNMIQGNLNHTSAIGDYNYNYNIVPTQASSTRKAK
jgi:hypothetical protein